MGCTAQSSVLFVGKKSKVIYDTGIEKSFWNAVQSIELWGHKADSKLQSGGLNSEGAVRFLETATGKSVRNPLGWNIEQVKVYATIANWDFVPAHNELGDYLSAKHFLEICAKHSLSIKFTC